MAIITEMKSSEMQEIIVPKYMVIQLLTDMDVLMLMEMVFQISMTFGHLMQVKQLIAMVIVMATIPMVRMEIIVLMCLELPTVMVDKAVRLL